MVRSGSRELPATLRDLLRGRVDALSEPARQLLAVVAVAGRQVPHRLLAAVTGLDNRSWSRRCGLRWPASCWPPCPVEDGYDLRHALLREVIDADLLPGERARLHTALAHTIADLLRSGELDCFGSAAEVAMHWYQARDHLKALEWSVRAAIEQTLCTPTPRPRPLRAGTRAVGSGRRHRGA